MGISGSGPKEQKPSAQDIALAKKGIADAKIFDQYYAPLEQQAIDSVSGTTGVRNRQTQEDLLAGRGNADLAIEEANAKAANLAANIQQGSSIDSASAVSSRQELGAGVAEGSNANITDAATTARNNQDAERLGVIRTGRDVNRQAGSALAHSANLANSRALNKVRNKTLQDNAKSQALGQVLSSGIAAGVDQYKKAGAESTKYGADGKPSGTKNTYSNEELGNGGRLIRKYFG